MKQLLQSRTATVLLAVVAGLVVAVGLAEVLDIPTWYEARTAIQDIAQGNNAARARTTLETLNDRAYVLEKLEEAAEDDTWNVRAKSNILTMLNMFSQPRSLRRALDSRSPTTQRAACTLLWGDPEAKTRCAEIALEWLKDEKADDRGLAANICGQLDLAEAQPVLLTIVEKDPRTEGEQLLFARALAGIKDPKPRELLDRLLQLASDTKVSRDIRAIALESLQRTKEGPRDQVLQLSIGIVKDPAADPILRAKAALGLGSFPEDRAWEALSSVLLSEKEQDRILQRQCLFALGQMEPADKEVARRYIDQLKQLLLDRRVYQNPYFAIRVDVATALSAMNVREPITLDIMCDYLVDEDKDNMDREHLVRQEGFLTLWALTGAKFPEVPADLFQIPPLPFPDPLAAREFFFRRAHHRPGITKEQSGWVAKASADLSQMQKFRQSYQSLKARILDQWRVEAEAKRAKEAGKVEPPAPPPGNAGPQAPPQQPAGEGEEKGPGEEEPPKKDE